MASDSTTPAFDAALDLLRRCTTDDGILATPTEERNYRRIWARDSVMCGLAGLVAEDETVTRGLRRTLDVLAQAQGPDGQIPSNVRLEDGTPTDVSYGGLAGRVDPIPWFVIGLAHYVQATGDGAFGARHASVVADGLQLMKAWEFNDRGLVYVPLGGDWADEYVLHGYVFFDQVLRLWALRCYAAVLEGPSPDPSLRHTLTATFAPTQAVAADAAYHPHAYRRYVDRSGDARFWLAALSPSGYQTQFDALGNAIAVLAGLGSADHRRQLLATGERIRRDRPGGLIPAFWPAITHGDPDWPALTDNYRDTFSNEPGHYHNGGLWPMVNGWWGMAMAAEGRTDEARALLGALHDANRDGDGPFLFPEYRDAHDGAPQGTGPLGW